MCYWRGCDSQKNTIRIVFLSKKCGFLVCSPSFPIAFFEISIHIFATIHRYIWHQLFLKSWHNLSISRKNFASKKIHIFCRHIYNRRSTIDVRWCLDIFQFDGKILSSSKLKQWNIWLWSNKIPFSILKSFLTFVIYCWNSFMPCVPCL